MNFTLNSINRWNVLLKNEDYLADESNSAKIRVSRVTTLLRNLRVESVLNIGSGQGYLEKNLRNLKSKIFWVSMDISEVGLCRISNELVSAKVLGYAHRLPFKDASFQSCVCMEVLEHIPKEIVSKVYSELRRILFKDGFLFISIPVFEPNTLLDHPVGHVRKYVLEEILKEINSNRFEVISIYDIYAFGIFYEIKKVLSRVLRIRRPSGYLLVCRKR